MIEQTPQKTIWDGIIKKVSSYTAQVQYYDGDQPTVYLTDRLAEIFRGVSARITQNWCGVVVDACTDRINLKGFQVDDKKAAEVLKQVWEFNSLAIESSDIHETAEINSESFAIVWPNEDGQVEVYYNDPRTMFAVYDPDAPRRILYAGKIFDGADGNARMTIYYPDQILYFRADKGLAVITNDAAFIPDETMGSDGVAANPYGKVPVFHFRTNRRQTSELLNVIPLQDAVNKLLIDMLVAAEYGAFKQRYVISQGDTSGLKNAPNMVWELPASDGVGQATQVGEFQSTDLNNYLSAMNQLAQSIGIITRTPKHYFYSQGGDPSGEALIALEAPLNHKAQDRIDRYTPTWKELAAFVCQLAGVSVAQQDVTPLFQKPETVQPRTAAEITKIRRDSGLPLKTALRWEGKTETEVEAMEADANEEKSAAADNMALALLKAERMMKEEKNPTSVPVIIDNNA